MSNLDDIKVQNTNEDGIVFSSWSFSNDMKEILETMTGIKVTEGNVTPESIKDLNQQVSGVIILVGSKVIMFTISMSRRTAVNLVAAMTGSSTTDIKHPDIIDGVAEIANIVGGKMKAKLSSEGEKYNAVLPYTIMGDNHYIVHKSKATIFSRKYNAESVEFVVSVYAL